jgi:hypothetical protein
MAFDTDISSLIEWKPLKWITSAQRQSDSYNQQITISKLSSTYIRYKKVVWYLSIGINLIPLTN